MLSASDEVMTSPPVIEQQKKQFSYKELLELERSGLLGNEHIELLEGEIIMAPPNPSHTITTIRISDIIDVIRNKKAN